MSREAVGKKRLNHRGEEESLRCLCGSLLARLTPLGVELKCKRCKRFVVIPLAEDRGLKNPTARKPLLR